MSSLIFPETWTRAYGAFINDDWKITPNLTLNLGLRWEFQHAYREENRLTRPLDLSSPIPEFQGAGAPVMPDGVKQFYSGPWIFNGAFQFADENQRAQWNSGSGTLSPRIGVAYRINDLTSIRAAYGRYITPWTLASSNEGNGGGGTNLLEANVPGSVQLLQRRLPRHVQGVPVMRLRDPWPAAYPLVQTKQRALGRYTSLGDSITYLPDERTRRRGGPLPNLSFQRQLPTGVVIDLTYYFNRSNFQWDLTRDLNMVDPRIAYQYKAATNVQVNNPFYNILTTDKFPAHCAPRTVGAPLR